MADEAVRKIAAEKFSLARVVAAGSWPYLTRAVMRLVPRWSDSCPTLGVDQYARLYLNADYVASLTVADLALKIAGHELQHVLGLHSERLLGDRDKVVDGPNGGTMFGTAANLYHDLAINSGLKSFVESAKLYRAQAGSTTIPFEVPSDGVYPHQYCDCNGKQLPVGLISEEYAELLRFKSKPMPVCYVVQGQKGKDGKDGTDGGSGKGDKKGKVSCGSGGGDTKQPWEDGDEPDPNDPESGASKAELDTIRQQVAIAAVEQETRMRGTVPGDTKRWAESYLKPSKLPWRRLLRRAVRESVNRIAGRSDYTWSRVSRRSPEDVVLPGMIDPEPDIVVGLDTSGSMGHKDLDAAFREIHSVLKTVGFRKVPMLVCDAAVHAVQMISDVREVKMVGGGGTDMRVLIAAAATLKRKLLVLISDGYSPWTETPTPGMKVIVCLTQTGARNSIPDWITTVVCED